MTPDDGHLAEDEARHLVAGALGACAGVLAGLSWTSRGALAGAAALGLAALAVLRTQVGARALSATPRTAPARAGVALLALALVTAALALGAGVDETRAVALADVVAAPGLLLALHALLRLEPPAARRVLLVAASVGLVVRLCLFVADPRGLATPDTASYLGGAHGLLAGEGLTSVHPNRTPGYPLFYAATAGSLGLLGHRAANCLVLGPLTALLAHAWLGRAGARPATRAAVAAFLLLCPDLVIVEWQVMSEPLFTGVLLAGALAVADATTGRGDARLAAAAGLLLGLATLVRPAAEPLLVVAAAAAALRVRPWPRPLLVGGATLAAAALPLGAWCLRNLAVHGAARLTFFGGMTLLASAAPEFPLDVEPNLPAKRAIAGAVEAYRDHPERIVPFVYGPDGALSRLRPLAPSWRELDDLTGALGREAIAAHPLRWAARRVWIARFYLLPSYRRTCLEAEAGTADHAVLRARQEEAWVQPVPQVTRALLDGAPLRALEARPALGAAGWQASRLLLGALDGLLYPVTLLLPFVATALVALRRRGPQVGAATTLVVSGWSLLAVASVANLAEVRYALPAWPLFLVAAAVTLRAPVVAADPGPARADGPR